MEMCTWLSMKMGKIISMSTLKYLTQTEAMAMRLIDADKIFQKVKGSTASKAVKCLAEVLVATAPTVDAVVVTRCKDCKNAYINSFSAAPGEALCTLSGQPMQQDDFCSYGERREV